MSAPLKPLPAWADVALIPLINVAAAFVISGLVVLAIGENPLEAVKILVAGALGDLEGIGFTLYYATSFIFTGLAVAICFHAGLFNIGVEGQAYVAGLGAALRQTICKAMASPWRARMWGSSAKALTTRMPCTVSCSDSRMTAKP